MSEQNGAADDPKQEIDTTLALYLVARMVLKCGGAVIIRPESDKVTMQHKVYPNGEIHITAKRG